MGKSQVLLALLVVSLTSMVSSQAYPPRAMPPALPPVKLPTLPPTKPYKPPTLPPLSPPPPYKPPTLPPLSPPPPYKKPTLPPFKFPRAAIQGVVYCMSCQRPGFSAPWGTPIKDAVVSLVCKNKYTQVAKTDKKGSFFIDPKEKLTAAMAKYCKVKLVSSPVKYCTKPTNLHNGITGAYLKPENKSFFIYKNPYKLFSVPILTFQSDCKY